MVKNVKNGVNSGFWHYFLLQYINMPRPLRIILPDLPFHVLNRGNNRQRVFLDEADFLYYLGLLKRFKEELDIKLYHFCLMPNHTHFIIEPTIEGSLSKFMLKITLAYTRYFNKKYKGVGHVWQGRYKASLLDGDDYFIQCGLYNELNPVRAGLVKNPEDWQFSSFRYYGLGERDSMISNLIDADPFYFGTGDNIKEQSVKYFKNIQLVMEEDFLNNLRRELDQGIFGKDSFIKDVKDKFKIGSLRPSGRPRKNQS